MQRRTSQNKLFSKILKLSAIALSAQLALGVQTASAWSLFGGGNKANTQTSVKQAFNPTKPSIPFYPYLDISMADVTASGTQFGDTTSDIEVDPKFLSASNDGVIIDFILGKMENGKLVPTLGGHDITTDNAQKDPYVQAWVGYVKDMQQQAKGKHVIISFGGADNASDLAAVAVNNHLAQSDVENAMREVLDVFDANSPSNNHIAFDFDIEGGMESNDKAVKLYVKALQDLTHKGSLLGFKNKNDLQITDGLTIPTLQAGLDYAGQNLVNKFSGTSSYTNIMAFDMGGNPTPAVNSPGRYPEMVQTLLHNVNSGKLAFTFMPGDEDGAGGRLFLSPDGAKKIATELAVNYRKVPFISMWQQSRDKRDTTTAPVTPSLNPCYVLNQTVTSVEGGDVMCTGQIQSAFAYTNAFTGHTSDSNTKPYSITHAGNVSLVQKIAQNPKDGQPKYFEGYGDQNGLEAKSSGAATETRMFVDTNPNGKDPSVRDGVPTQPHKFASAYTWANEDDSDSSDIKVLLGGLFQVCDQSDQAAPCLARSANAIDGDGSKNADKSVNMVVMAQTKDSSFQFVGGSAAGSTLNPISVALPILKNRVVTQEPLSVAPVLNSNFYSGHDLWIYAKGSAKADWGNTVYSSAITTGDSKTFSASQSAKSGYIHLIFSNDKRSPDNYTADSHDVFVDGAPPSNLSPITQLRTDFLAQHGICDKTDKDCINNRPGLSATTPVTIKAATSSSAGNYEYINSDGPSSSQGNVSTDYIMDDEALLSWSPVATDNPGYIKYAVSLNGSNALKDFVTSASDKIKGLTQNTTYSVTVIPYVCTNIAGTINNGCRLVSLTPETTTFTTKALSTADGKKATIKVYQDPSTSVGESAYALYDVDVLPSSDAADFDAYGNWPKDIKFDTGNLDSFVFQMQIKNENAIAAPKCTIENTDPVITQDNTHAHSDGYNMVFDQSWFVTSGWKSKLWSCEQLDSNVVSQGGAAVPAVTGSGQTVGVGSAKHKVLSNVGGNDRKLGEANIYVIHLNDLPLAVPNSNNTVNLKEFQLTFTTSNLKQLGWGGNGVPVNVNTFRLHDDISDVGDADTTSETMTRTLLKNGQYQYDIDIKLKAGFPIKHYGTSSGDRGKLPYLTISLPFSVEQYEATSAMQEINRDLNDAGNSQLTFTMSGAPGVKEVTYLVHRNKDIYASDSSSAHPHSRWMNYPLWLDNIFRVENADYPFYKGKNSHVRIQLGFDFPTSTDATKVGHKDDIIGQGGEPYNNTTSDWDKTTSPKAKAFADTTFNPLSFLPADKMDELRAKNKPKVALTVNMCIDKKNNATHFDLEMDDAYTQLDGKPGKLWFPDEYDFEDTNDGSTWSTHQLGWSIQVPNFLEGLDPTKFNKDAMGGIKPTYSNGSLTLTSAGTYQGLRPDVLPLEGSEVIYDNSNAQLTIDNLNDLVNRSKQVITWTQQVPPGSQGATNLQKVSGNVTYKIIKGYYCPTPKPPPPPPAPIDNGHAVISINGKPTDEGSTATAVRYGDVYTVDVYPGDELSLDQLRQECNSTELALNQGVFSDTQNMVLFVDDDGAPTKVLSTPGYVGMKDVSGIQVCEISGAFGSYKPSTKFSSPMYFVFSIQNAAKTENTIEKSTWISISSGPAPVEKHTITAPDVTVAAGKSANVGITEDGYKSGDRCDGLSVRSTDQGSVTLDSITQVATSDGGETCLYNGTVHTEDTSLKGITNISIKDTDDSTVKDGNLNVNVTAAGPAPTGTTVTFAPVAVSCSKSYCRYHESPTVPFDKLSGLSNCKSGTSPFKTSDFINGGTGYVGYSASNIDTSAVITCDD